MSIIIIIITTTNTGGVNIGGRRIKCIRFADDMALLAEDETMLKNILMEPNDM